MFYSGSPYLGAIGASHRASRRLNQCGEYYIISHNHALYQITSWGVTMTGPITYCGLIRRCRTTARNATDHAAEDTIY